MIPVAEASLALWPASPIDPRFRCLVTRGQLPAARALRLRELGGFERPFVAGQSVVAVFEMFEASPGWHDPAAALAEFTRVDTLAEGRAMLAEGVARRVAAMAGAEDLAECCRRLVAAGEMQPSTARAIIGADA